MAHSPSRSAFSSKLLLNRLWNCLSGVLSGVHCRYFAVLLAIFSSQEPGFCRNLGTHFACNFTLPSGFSNPPTENCPSSQEGENWPNIPLQEKFHRGISRESQKYFWDPVKQGYENSPAKRKMGRSPPPQPARTARTACQPCGSPPRLRCRKLE